MKLVSLIVLMFVTLNVGSQLIYNGQSFAFVGPMLHFNVGNGQTKVSLGVEASYWKIIDVDRVPVGADLGIDYEFGTGKLRIYSEAQAGSGIGLSLGPLVEIKDREATMGFQASTWVTLIGGIDFRWRKTDKHYFAPGLMLKLPMKTM